MSALAEQRAKRLANERIERLRKEKLVASQTADEALALIDEGERIPDGDTAALNDWGERLYAALEDSLQHEELLRDSTNAPAGWDERVSEHLREVREFLASARCNPPSGPFRPIYASFLKHPRTRLLSDAAMRVLVPLRVIIGPTGIEKHHGLHGLLAEYLPYSYSDDTIEGALAELESMRFIRRDGPIVWIRDQLRDNPSMSVTNPAHLRTVQKHVATLPKDARLVIAWCNEYPEWLGPVQFAPGHGKHRTIPEGLSDGPSREPSDVPETTRPETTRPLTKRLPVPEEQQGGGELGNWLSPAVAILAVAFRPRSVTPEVEKHARELRAKGVTAERLAAAARALLAEKGLESAGLPMLLKEYPRWQRKVHEADAGERWELYKREGLTRVTGVDFDTVLADLAQRGVWPSIEAARSELTSVKPWDIGRRGLRREDSVRLVAERLNAA